MFCKQCGTLIEDGVGFCPNCGEKVTEEITADAVVSEAETAAPVQPAEETVSIAAVEDAPQTENANVTYCPACGAENIGDTAFCHACGAALSAYDATNGQPAKKSKKGIVAAIAAVAVVVCVIAVVGGLLTKVGGSSKAKANLLYLKDNEIVGLKGSKSYVIGDDAFDDKDDASYYAYALTNSTYISSDGKYIYYPQDYDGGSFNLYYKKLGNEKAEETKIASKISNYKVLDNGNVLYLDDGKLYLYSLKKADKEKVASDVNRYYLSDDEKTILWLSDDDKLYYIDTALKKEKTKLDSDVTGISYYSDDLKKIVYTKDDGEAVYLLTDLKDTDKIASDISRTIVCPDGNELNIYYIKSESDDSVSYMDLMYDDMAADDADIKEPDTSDYQTEKTSGSGYWTYTYTTTDWDAYYAARDIYNAKQQRDYLRESYSEYSYGGNDVSVYCYNTKSDESTKVYDGIMSTYDYYGSRNSVFFYVAVNTDNLGQVKFSEYVDMEYEDQEKALEDAYVEGLELYIVKDGSAVKVDADLAEYGYNINMLGTSDKAKKAYLTLTSDYTDYALFEVATDKINGSANLLNEEYVSFAAIGDTGIYYVSDSDDYNLYLNDKKIDSDVATGYFSKIDDGAGLVYITDYDTDDASGTLKKYTGSKTVEIADDVYDYDVASDGNIALLVDYSLKRFKGDLKLYKNNKLTDIDSDVTAIIRY
jgi:hypothetical protein